MSTKSQMGQMDSHFHYSVTAKNGLKQLIYMASASLMRCTSHKINIIRAIELMNSMPPKYL